MKEKIALVDYYSCNRGAQRSGKEFCKLFEWEFYSIEKDISELGYIGAKRKFKERFIHYKIIANDIRSLLILASWFMGRLYFYHRISLPFYKELAVYFLSKGVLLNSFSSTKFLHKVNKRKIYYNHLLAGIDCNFFRKKNIVWVGSEHRRKNLTGFIKLTYILASIGKFEYHAFGLSHEYNLPNHVKNRGFINMPLNEFGENDVLVISSLSEGLPRIGIEALDKGMTVWVNNVDGMKDLMSVSRSVFAISDVTERVRIRKNFIEKNATRDEVINFVK